MSTEQTAYGYELILDLHGCDVATFTQESLTEYFIKLCETIDMQREDLHFWMDLETPEPHLRGISAVQFILTSMIVVHTLELLGKVFVNVFSCKTFDPLKVDELTRWWFRASQCHSRLIERI